MCLLEVYTDEDMNRIVEELPEVAPGVVEVWKLVYIDGLEGFATSPSWQQTIKGGCAFPHQRIKILNESNQSYWSGFHFWPDKKSAKTLKEWAFGIAPWCNHKIIRCFIKKSWIATVGKAWSNNDIKDIALVASQAFFPTYPETEAKLEDFLAWLKENDPEYAESQLCKMAVK